MLTKASPRPQTRRPHPTCHGILSIVVTDSISKNRIWNLKGGITASTLLSVIRNFMLKKPHMARQQIINTRFRTKTALSGISLESKDVAKTA
ncbi:MAG: hypothetical protein KAH86_04220, partial [Methanosarcinales archaeon]|nr:hypothetical protein [Methanosarcinales archaeon]